MNKELEALDWIENIFEEHQVQLPDVELTLIREAITPPTADEVCLSIMKHYESKIVFYNELAKTFNEVHLTRNEEVVSNYANGEVGINYNALPPHLITMIGKFYESLEGEK